MFEEAGRKGGGGQEKGMNNRGHEGYAPFLLGPPPSLYVYRGVGRGGLGEIYSAVWPLSAKSNAVCGFF